MDVSELLRSTQEGFADWQSQGKRKGYPTSLKNKAIKLLDYYRAQDLCKLLSVSTKSLRDWREAKTRCREESADFLPLAIPQKKHMTHSNPSTALTLKLPCNLQLILPEAPLCETVQLIHALVKEFGPCSI